VSVVVDGVSHRYGGVVALSEMSVVVQPGEVVAVVGPHASGKTTLLRLLAGVQRPTRGSVQIGGHTAGTAQARDVTGYATDPPLPPPELTGWEWLHYVASQHARSASHRQVMVRHAASFGGITAFAHRRIGRHPRDAAQRLAVAAAAMAGRALVVLDEPLSGLDPLVVRELQDALARLARAGRVIVIAAHDLATVERLATRVLVLWEGRLVADVQTATLLGERVAELSLSGGALAHTAPLLCRFRGAVRTGGGIAVPLLDGLTVEGLLHDCRELRIAVSGSRVRYRVLEDLFLAAAQGRRGVSRPL
jgi:ABC-type multidrug transport system ATPase subunit